ncbi:MAG: tetratricopeptide repeat protein [Deltaproteobacteria bacterium]|nr:tetratricopeptide repeat protein [Deltaproteobacteria bacterium]
MKQLLLLISFLIPLKLYPGQNVLYNKINDLIEELRLDEAERLISNLTLPEDEGAYLKGKIAFYRGRYEESYNHFSLSKKQDYIIRCAINAYHITSKYKRHETNNFIIFYPDEKEEVYLEYLTEGLEYALKTLSPIFGYQPKEKIRIEILNKQSDLEKLTTLPLEAIEKTNTIAVTKFNKIMISSPKTQIDGYDYIGTATHELIHLMISTITHERTPVWIHEALARYFDRYTPDRIPTLRPDVLGLLRRRVEKNSLITFEQIHPSMALLPSQEDTTVAFAEVFLVSEYLHKKIGLEFVKRMLNLIKEQKDMDYIFQNFGFSSFKGFEDEFLKYLKKKIENSYSAEQLYYAPTSNKKNKKEYLGDVYTMKYMKLGDLLFLENLFEAAYIEYEKASKSGLINPHIENRKAFALINAKRYNDAANILEKIKDLYPDYYSTFVNLSRAYLPLKNYSKALEALERAVRLNPFDKEIYLMFLKIFVEQNNEYEADKTRKKIEILSKKD